MPANDSLEASSRIVFREEGDDALLFDPDSGNVKVLNDTGKLIWKNLNGKNSKDSLVEKIKETFDSSDEKKIRDDLDKFVADLKKLKFLEQGEDKAGKRSSCC